MKQKVPEAWEEAPTRKGTGWRWRDPSNISGNSIRIDKGDPSNPQPSQQVDHVVIRSNGKGIGRGGVPYDSIQDNWFDAHIPLEDWLAWQLWNKP
ncbi:MAG: hypothetical protein IAE83_00110 [Anaerolinea sp.]|nr:hypothetical protein [Anaerolinea sp.]